MLRKLSSPIALHSYYILTAVGADNVCRQREICNRTITRRTGKIEQSMRALDVKDTGSCLARWRTMSVNIDNSMQAYIHAR